MCRTMVSQGLQISDLSGSGSAICTSYRHLTLCLARNQYFTLAVVYMLKTGIRIRICRVE